MVVQEVFISELKSVVGHMEAAYTNLKTAKGPPLGLPDFELAHFWYNLCLSIKKISTEVTKLSLMYSKPPVPTNHEAKELLQSMDAAFVDVLSIFYTLSKDQGKSLYEVVHKSVMNVIESVIAVIKSLQENGIEAQKDRLKLTGFVWEACESVEVLPQNNLQVIQKAVKMEEALVADAVQEIEEEVKSDSRSEDDISVTWNHLDRSLLSPCIGLVKTARSCLKKINQTVKAKGKCDTADQITQLDAVAQRIRTFSPAVDDFIESIYPPINRSEVKNVALIIVSIIKDVLTISQQSHFITEDDQSWIDFLLKAADHNNNKLQPLLI